MVIHGVHDKEADEDVKQATQGDEEAEVEGPALAVPQGGPGDDGTDTGTDAACCKEDADARSDLTHADFFTDQDEAEDQSAASDGPERFGGQDAVDGRRAEDAAEALRDLCEPLAENRTFRLLGLLRNGEQADENRRERERHGVDDEGRVCAVSRDHEAAHRSTHGKRDRPRGGIHRVRGHQRLALADEVGDRCVFGGDVHRVQHHQHDRHGVVEDHVFRSVDQQQSQGTQGRTDVGEDHQALAAVAVRKHAREGLWKGEGEHPQHQHQTDRKFGQA